MRKYALAAVLLLVAIAWTAASRFADRWDVIVYSREMSQASEPPEKIRLIPDQWHLQDVGALEDGRLFWISNQIDTSTGETRDFVCTFIFDRDGKLVDRTIDLIGTRSDSSVNNARRTFERHSSALGPHTKTSIWVQLFKVEAHGSEFGLEPRNIEGGGWVIDFVPGMTLMFYPPWSEGGYNT